jgi:hypothetical protein
MAAGEEKPNEQRNGKSTKTVRRAPGAEWILSLVCLSNAAAAGQELPSGAGTWTRPSASAPGSAADSLERLAVWVDLSEPALAGLSRASAIEREAHRRRILEQQDRVAAALRSLGAVELARVQLLRNSIAVHLPRDQVGAAGQISGVLALRPLRDVHRSPPHPRD